MYMNVYVNKYILYVDRDFGSVKHSVYRLVNPGDFFRGEILQDEENFRITFSYVVINYVIYDQDSVLSSFFVDLIQTIN